jgi:predicted transcriptional regulator
MQEMQSPDVSRLLADRHSARIILATMRNPRSAFDISECLGMPIAVCFRKIKLLEDAGLIACAERRFAKNGKKISLFKSTLRNSQMVLERNKVQAKIEMFDGSTQEVKYEMDMPTFLPEATRPA